MEQLPGQDMERTLLKSIIDVDHRCRTTKFECLVTAFLWGAESKRSDAANIILQQMTALGHGKVDGSKTVHPAIWAAAKAAIDAVKAGQVVQA